MSSLTDTLATQLRGLGPAGAAQAPVADQPDRLRRGAIVHTAVVTATALVVGLFVHGETAFLTAWVYIAAAVALPALLVNWMVARRELGDMPGGRAWSLGLVFVYVDGLGLLYLAARPDPTLRSLAVLAVVPPIVCFATATASLAQAQAQAQVGGRLGARQVLTRAAVVTTALGAVTLVALGERLLDADAGWLARPAALVAVAMTAGAFTSAHQFRHVDGPARPLALIGLAVLAVGALASWAIMAQALSDFTLPASPVLALQVVTLGLVLQIPIHAPRAPGLAVVAGDEPHRRSVVEIVSREWFAEDPAEDGVLPRRLRRPALLYVAITAPLLGLLGLVVEGRTAFLMAWVYASAVYTTPALVVTWAASRRTNYQAHVWRLWFLAIASLYLNGAGLLLTTVLDSHAVARLAVVAVVPCVALFLVSAIAMMRARSGSRSVVVDVIETTMVTTVVCFAVLLLVGDRVWRNDEAWFTIPTALVTVAVTSGLVWSVMIYTRMPHENRALERLALALAVIGCVNAWAMLAQGLSGFTLPSAPLLALQAVTMGLLLLLPLYVPRTAPHGLEHLPPHEQVRNGVVVVALTLAALPLLFVQTLVVHEARPWGTTMFIVVLMGLLVLAMARQFVAVNETRGLYRQVTEAGAERRRLLADIMRSVEDDRHRFASQLHDQAIFSYAAFVSVTREVELAQPGSGATLLAGVSTQVRDDLADQAESLRHLMLAIRPLEAAGARTQAQRIASPVRAYVDSLYGDVAAPDLRLAVRDDIVLDWTTETIVLRVVQEAVGNICRHADARTIDVLLDVDDDFVLVLDVVDDGVGFDPDTVVAESGIATMRSFAALADADLTIDTRPGGGTRVRVRFDGDTTRSGAVAAPSLQRGANLSVAPD